MPVGFPGEDDKESQRPDEPTAAVPPGDVTQLLNQLRTGDEAAKNQLAEVVYDELHRMAAQFMRRERSDHTLQATALVHDAYMKLVSQRDKSWQNRTHFFAVASQAMRRILVDHARTRGAAKRGGRGTHLPLEEELNLTHEDWGNLLEIDQALSRLSQHDPRQGRIVELRFFGGLTEEQIAEVMSIGLRTVKRDWSVAKLWLTQELRPDQDNIVH